VVRKQVFFKLVKVGQYWHRRNSVDNLKVLRSHTEVDLKRAFNLLLLNSKSNLSMESKPKENRVHALSSHVTLGETVVNRDN
jgi:hypothetical protein